MLFTIAGEAEDHPILFSFWCHLYVFMKDVLEITRKKLMLGLFTVLLGCGQIFFTHAQNPCYPLPITVNSANTILNTYYPGLGGATSGSSSISLGEATGAAIPISSGDLVLVIQVQRANINSSNTDSYGSGSSGLPASGHTNNHAAGTYEFAFAANSVPLTGGTLSLQSPLANGYTDQNPGTNGQRRYQVVRVPRAQALIINSGASITSSAWNGSSGGIVALDIEGVLNMNSTGTINVTGRGFRGGAYRRLNGQAGGSNADFRNLSTNNYHGSKGEGISGTPRFIFFNGVLNDNGVEGYPDGSTARGAPGNAGGGATDGATASNSQNSGGGGGGNGGEGGRGGNSWNTNLAVGGFGGAVPTFLGATRLVFGGGGGAASANDFNTITFSGQAGGGIVIIRAGSISNAGQILANGLSAPKGAAAVQNDGGSGAGAGGTVYLNIANPTTLSTLVVRAEGGNGGDAWPTQSLGTFPGNAHGPGGGGGGGVIYANGSLAPTSSVAGGLNGVTTTSNIAYNSTSGGEGIINLLAPTLVYTNDPCSFTDLAVTKTVNSTSPVIGQTVIFTVTATNNGPGNATGVSVSDLLPSGYIYSSHNAPAGTTYNSVTGIWSIGDLNYTNTLILTITATVTAI